MIWEKTKTALGEQLATQTEEVVKPSSGKCVGNGQVLAKFSNDEDSTKEGIGVNQTTHRKEDMLEGRL